MRQDPLQVLLRLRQRAVEQARLAVVEAVKREHQVIAAIQAIDQSSERSRLAQAEGLQNEAYLGHVLGQGRALLRAKRAAAQVRLQQAETVTADRRADLTEARSQSESVEKLIAERKAAAAALLERRTAHELDDVFRSQWLRRRASGSQHESMIGPGDSAVLQHPQHDQT